MAHICPFAPLARPRPVAAVAPAISKSSVFVPAVAAVKVARPESPARSPFHLTVTMSVLLAGAPNAIVAMGGTPIEEELTVKKGDKVAVFDDQAPIDTVLGVEIFPVIHMKTQEKIYVSLEDIKDG